MGIGVAVNVNCGDRFVGAFLFSIALLSVIEYGLPLYTGRIGFGFKMDLIPALLFNCMGVCACLLVCTPADKFDGSYWSMFVEGVFCGVLMYLAVKTKKPLCTVMCIMVFILSGYEHCIADFPSLVMYFSWESLGKWGLVVLGNSVGSLGLRWLLE